VCQVRARRGEEQGTGQPVARGEEAARASLCDDALKVAGELGWRRLSVAAVASRAGISRARFYRLFADREECLAAAHRRRTQGLLEGLPDDLDAAAARRALSRLAEMAETEPLLARGLLAETRLAGGAVSASREEVFERLTRAVRDACRETTKPRHSPPPIAAQFILAALQSAVVEATAREDPRPLGNRIDALCEVAVRAFGGRAPSGQDGHDPQHRSM
jgi:AcrR family transcriptional regulator